VSNCHTPSETSETDALRTGRKRPKRPRVRSTRTDGRPFGRLSAEPAGGHIAFEILRAQRERVLSNSDNPQGHGASLSGVEQHHTARRPRALDASDELMRWPAGAG
jgi:hypothetical protein